MKKMRNLILICLFLMSGIGLSAQNVMKAGHYQAEPNSIVTIDISIDNSAAFVAFQVDIPIDEHFSYIAGSAQLNTSRISGHVLTASIVTGNVLRLIGYSVANTPFVGNSGTLVSFQLKAPAIPGVYALSLNQALLGNGQSANILTGTENGSVTVIAPNINLSTLSLSYGRVPMGSSVQMNFQINNNGNSALVVNGLTFTDSQFSTTENPGFSIAPQTSKTIAVRFTPVSAGNVNQQLFIQSNDPNQPTMSITLNAVVYMVNELHTNDLTGASTTTQTLDFTINNMEAFTGFQFDITLPQALTYQSGTAQLFRAQGHTVLVNELENNRLRVLTFSSGNTNFTGNAGKVVSLDFRLEGVAGNYPITISNVIIVNSAAQNIVSDSYPGVLHITSADIHAGTTVEFGNVSILSEKEVSHRIYNYGQEPLEISQLLFSNPCFTTSQTLPVSIQPGTYLDLNLKFQKSAKGAETGVLRIFSNDPDENPFTIQLSANAYVPNSMSVHSQTMHLGETKNLEIAIENEDEFVAFQFDLTYPVGLVPDINNLVLERKQDHTVSASLLSESSMRVIVFSITQKPFLGKSGVVLTIPITATSNLSIGTYNLILNNALISNAQSDNVLWNVEAGSLEITKLSQTITFPALEPKTYGDVDIVLGQTSDAGLEITYTSDNESVATINGNTVVLHNAGSAQITATQSGNANYDAATPVTRTLVIGKAALTITADDATRKEGEPNPAFTLSYTGFKNNETESVLDQLPSIYCPATIYSPVGFYDIILSGGYDNNYDYQFSHGRLEVIPQTGIDDVAVQNISIYPNPVKHDLFIKSDAPIDRIEIYNQSGVRVLINDTFTEKMDVSQLENGFYLVRIWIDNNVFTKKIIVKK